MSAGKLTQRITLSGLSAGTDALGQPLQTWVDVTTTWADVRFVSGIETIKAGREISTSRASVRIRRRSGITRQMRARIGGVEYGIVDVVPSPDRAWLTLICEVCQ
jgi:SPP1 family predicted phage head-tail adaptor